MGRNFCISALTVVCLIIMPFTSSKILTINEYFPEIHREISKVTWAHAVNSHVELKNALDDSRIMMLEADIVMGTHDGFEDIQPIMAHPPAKSSDLTFVQFLETVLRSTKTEGKRKGIKLDFKEIEAVEPCLQALKSRLEDSRSPSIPVFINADILQGPVNSTKKPINPERFITLAAKYTPHATLSVGWTTRFGTDDPSDEIRDGKYSKQQMKEMLKLLRAHAGDPVVFPHVTFPVRAGLAAQSIEELLYLTSRVRTEDSSITLWSTHTDPVNRRLLQSLIHQTTARHCFIDLPFSVEEDQDDNDVDRHQNNDPNLSAIQQLEGRGQPEEESMSSGAASSPSFLSWNTLLPVIAMGIITTVFIAYRKL